MGRIYWNDSSRLVDSGAPIDVLAIGDSRLPYAFNNLITPLHAALEQPTMHVIGESGARPGCGCPRAGPAVVTGRTIPGKAADVRDSSLRKP